MLAALSSARFFGERLKNEFWKINGLKRSRNLKYGVFAPKRCDLGKNFKNLIRGLKLVIFRLDCFFGTKNEKIFYFYVAFLKILRTIIRAGGRTPFRNEIFGAFLRGR